MEAARKFDENPEGPNGRLAHLSEAEGSLPPSEVYDVVLEEFSDRQLNQDPRPGVEPLPADAPLTAETGFDFDPVAEFRIEPTDSPEQVIRLLRETGGVMDDEGEFAMGANLLEIIRLSLEGDPEAFEQLPEDSGLLQWVYANQDSSRAHEVFEQFHQIMHPTTDDSETPLEEDPAEALVTLLAPEADSRSTARARPRRRDRIRRRFRPLLGH